MTSTLNADLAQAHIHELRRQACLTRFAGLARTSRQRRSPLRRHRAH